MKTKDLGRDTPKLPAQLPERTWNPDPDGDEDRGRCTYADCTIDLGVREWSFDQIVFRNVVFTGDGQAKHELTDVVFDKCDLSNLDFSDAIVHRAEFRNCKIMGFQLSEAMLRNVLFADCAGDYANFRFATLKRVIFERNAMREADFYRSGWEQVRLRECLIDGAQLAGIDLAGVDLSDCEFTTLGVEPGDVRGCIISAGQAGVFARALGLVFK